MRGSSRAATPTICPRSARRSWRRSRRGSTPSRRRERLRSPADDTEGGGGAPAALRRLWAPDARRDGGHRRGLAGLSFGEERRETITATATAASVWSATKTHSSTGCDDITPEKPIVTSAEAWKSAARSTLPRAPRNTEPMSIDVAMVETANATKGRRDWNDP